MYPDWGVIALGSVLSVWLLVLSVFIFRQERFLKSLFPKSGIRDIRKKFGEIANVVLKYDNKILDINKKLEFLEKDGLRHIQKVKLVRYNPYEDTGGDQSFTVCFLDKENTGFVITSLHTRSGTRVFAKPVVAGKGTKYEFSKEEQEVIDLAI